MNPVIIDMDPGVDDALAIILALHSSELDVVGISVVNGNVPVDQGVDNTLKVLDLLGRQEIPVYVGAGKPLQREPVYAFEVHGPQGLGEAELPESETLPAGEAIAFLIEMIKARPGEVSLVALGPLTNLAMAEAREPGILSQVRQLVVMGGALLKPGNISPMNEFNFHVDPHAARQVIQSGANLILVPIGATRQVELEEEKIQQQVAVKKGPVVAFCEAAMRTAIAYAKRFYGYAGIHLHDPLAIGLAIDPQLCSIEPFWLDVETEGELTAGQVVVDCRPFVRDEDRVGYEVDCAVEVEVERFMKMFEERVLAEQQGISNE